MNAPYMTRRDMASEWAESDRIRRQEDMAIGDIMEGFTDQDWLKFDALVGAIYKRRRPDAIRDKLVDDLVAMLDACRDRELDKADPDDVLAAYDRHLAETAAYWDTP